MKNEFDEIVYNPTQTTPFTLKIKLKSHLWKLINATIFRIFPNQVKRPRIFLLNFFGAKISKTVNISRTARIDHPWNLEMGSLSSLGENSWIYCFEKITIKDKCCIGNDVYLLTGSHGVNSSLFDYDNKPITIGRGCWVSTGSYILPGVTLAPFTVVGAKSVVTKSTEPFSVVGGNPAKFLKKRELIK